MQRIKSQSTCLIPARPKSKKQQKPTDSLSRPKNNMTATENSMNSLRTNSKMLSGSSKNLKVGNCTSVTAKNSMPGTSRVNNSCSNAVISARILKQIVGYSQKLYKREGNQREDNQAIKLEIDLDGQIDNVDQESLFNLNSNKQRQTKNSTGKKQKSQKKYSFNNQNKNVREFSIAPQQQKRKSFSLYQEAPNAHNFFQEPDRANYSSNVVHNLQTRKQQQYHQQSHGLSNYFLQTSSKSPNYQCSRLNSSHATNPQISNLMQKGNKILTINAKPQENSDTALLRQKQQLVISLQQSNAFIQQHFQVNFKQIIPIWNGVIKNQKQTILLQKQILSLEANIQILREKDYLKKTQLFQVNRDQLCRKKQKEYLSKNSKQKYIFDAINAQQQLKTKLSSKADYEHVILFNQKVILTSQSSVQNLQNLFTQMFQCKLVKKFVMIAKKQVVNLSIYDSRLILDFFKKIQDLQTNYHKLQNNSTVQYVSGDEQSKLQQIVEQIQEITINLMAVNTKTSQLQKQISKIQNQMKEYQNVIKQFILQTNCKISGEYKMVEGYSFDFEDMLQEKYQKQYETYKKEYLSRQQIIERLQRLQQKIQKKVKNDQNEVQQSGYKKSCSGSITSTPSNSAYRNINQQQKYQVEVTKVRSHHQKFKKK